MATFAERMIGAARLNAATYEEVETDTGATVQAMLVVVLSSIAAGIGMAGAHGAGPIIGVTLAALVGWVVWAVLTYLIGTKMLPGPRTQADMGQLLRTTGFSASPGVLRVFGGIPGLGPVVVLVVSIWMLAAMVVAVRQALDYESTGRAVAVCVVGFLIHVGAIMLLGFALGGPGR
jgi:Yip1 domain